MEPSAKSSRLVIVQLGKKEDYSIKRFRGLVAKANRIVIKEDTVQWVSLADIENWEWHAAQVIKMVQYVIESTDHFEEQEIKNQFVIDFYKWCGIVNPELEN